MAGSCRALQIQWFQRECVHGHAPSFASMSIQTSAQTLQIQCFEQASLVGCSQTVQDTLVSAFVKPHALQMRCVLRAYLQGLQSEVFVSGPFCININVPTGAWPTWPARLPRSQPNQPVMCICLCFCFCDEEDHKKRNFPSGLPFGRLPGKYMPWVHLTRT